MRLSTVFGSSVSRFDIVHPQLIGSLDGCGCGSHVSDRFSRPHTIREKRRREVKD